MAAETVKLSNGYSIPQLGLGTWQSAPGEAMKIIGDAIDVGYRHFDCAWFYGNEKEIGDALWSKINEGAVQREDLFITSKLWNTFHDPEKVVPALKTSLENFGMEYLDLYLIHWPIGTTSDRPGVFVDDGEGKSPESYYSDADYLDTWREMERCVELGLAKSIGVSNFNSQQIERVLAIAKIKPVVNQVEGHPNLNQRKLTAFCKERDIAIIAYSPLGSPTRPWAKPTDPVLRLDDPKLMKIAKKHKKTTAQVILRYSIDIGMIPIPKSANKKRLQENINVFDFKLTPEDISVIDTFDCNGRLCAAAEFKKHVHYPFHLEF